MTGATGVQASAAGIAIVTVTYEPDIAILERQLDSLPRQSLRIVVDNGSRPDCVALLKHVADRTGVELVCNDANRGLAAALNQGVECAMQQGRELRYVLFLDQDSEPAPGSIERLYEVAEQLCQAGRRVGCVGPRIIDASTGLQHGFHQIKGWRWTRYFPPDQDAPPIGCANINGSGMLADLGLFKRLGGFEEDFFIDHVDTEFSFRMIDRGYELIGVPDADFLHRMGDAGFKFWFLGWRVWPLRSPARHYYLFRNASRLLRRAYVPRVWKLWALPKLLLTAAVHGAFDSRRHEQLRQMGRGLKNGSRGH